MQINENSFTAADTLPYKLFSNGELITSIVNGKIPPYHLQFYPTNRCNLNCSFCCCSDMDRKIEMPIEEIKEAIKYFAALGTKAVTLMGGGEPTIHKSFDEMVETFVQNNIKIGMVTNGIKFPEAIKFIEWVRVSSSDERDVPNIPVNKFNSVDWAFSYVLTNNPNIDNLIKHINFAQNNNFTHVRIVRDLLGIQDSILDEVKTLVEKDSNISIPIIWQDRRPNFEHGENPCYVSLLRPLLTADGFIYPCCSVQYAIPNPDNRLHEEHKMCHWTKYNNLIPFDGSICIRCSYGAHNHALKRLSDGNIHKEFL